MEEKQMAELLAAFAVLIAAPFCIGLLPALAMPGEKTAWHKERTGENRRAEEKGRTAGIRRLLWKRTPVSVCPAAVYAAGFVTMLAVFQIVAVPVILLETWGFPRIVTIYSILLAVLSAAGLIFGFPVLRGMAADARTLVAKKKRPSVENGALLGDCCRPDPVSDVYGLYR